ncbi:LytR/AlgR family response regulator transcription factor [Amycolatopsis thermoflava]|uniref:LytR/AlgR family response regulator transcription factor n=1 Tax=Amycolatopsis thermoflava TaxID=84480 RepID=UPI000423E0D6|nr:response regulator [Amycolatopsis thermoflava]
MTRDSSPAADRTRNALSGTVHNALQFRDVQGSVYINTDAAATPEAASHGGLHVMAVDDEPHGLDELVHLLQEDHRIAKVTPFTDTVDAVRYLGRPDDDEPLDGVFLDVRMPGLDGLHLARLVSRFAVRPGVVLVTAYESHAVDAFDFEATHYLLKPVARAKVAQAVDRLLKWRPSR